VTPLSTIRLVAKREIDARRRAVAIVMGLTALLVAAGMGVASLTADSAATPAALAPEDADELVGFFGTLVLFMAIIFTGQVILMGVAEEKNSRVVEVVLGTVRARHLLAGKILAIGALGVAEVVIATGTVLAVGTALDTVELPDTTAIAALTVLFWFVLGFAFYATVYAAAGALVTRTENAANAAVPINIALVIGYLLSTASAGSPDNPILRWASLLPPLAPLTMPTRMIDGSVAAWEVGMAAALTAAASYGLVRLAGRVYAGGVMQTGRVGWRAALRNAASS
jgi:ABC-2 type transport system permease protein